MNEPQRPHKRHVRNYLLNRRFQLKWTIAILLLTAALFGTLGGYIYWQEKHSSDDILEVMRTAFDAETAAVFEGMLETEDSGYAWGLLGIGGALILLLAGTGIVLTHKVAGPMYSLVRSFRRVKAGDYTSVRAFRKGDEFQEVSIAFREVVDALADNESSEIAELEKIRDMFGIPAEAASALDALLENKRSRVG